MGARKHGGHRERIFTPPVMDALIGTIFYFWILVLWSLIYYVCIFYPATAAADAAHFSNSRRRCLRVLV